MCVIRCSVFQELLCKMVNFSAEVLNFISMDECNLTKFGYFNIHIVNTTLLGL